MAFLRRMKLSDKTRLQPDEVFAPHVPGTTATNPRMLSSSRRQQLPCTASAHRAPAGALAHCKGCRCPSASLQTCLDGDRTQLVCRVPGGSSIGSCCRCFACMRGCCFSSCTCWLCSIARRFQASRTVLRCCLGCSFDLLYRAAACSYVRCCDLSSCGGRMRLWRFHAIQSDAVLLPCKDRAVAHCLVTVHSKAALYTKPTRVL